MTMGSGEASSICSRRGISVNFIRGTSNIYRGGGRGGYSQFSGVVHHVHAWARDLLEVLVIVDIFSLLWVL